MVVDEEDQLWFRAMLEYTRLYAQAQGNHILSYDTDKARNVANVAAAFADQAVLQWRHARERISRL
jgi:hypothetical protein